MPDKTIEKTIVTDKEQPSAAHADPTKDLVDLIREQQRQSSKEKMGLMKLFGLFIGGLMLLFAGVLGISMKLDFFGVFGGSTEKLSMSQPVDLDADGVFGIRDTGFRKVHTEAVAPEAPPMIAEEPSMEDLWLEYAGTPEDTGA
jgi:hypothetical protein